MDTLDVTVVRSQWYRGKGSSRSRLLIGEGHKDEGKMCCLGFAALAAKLTREEIEGRPCPSHVLNARIAQIPEPLSIISGLRPEPLPEPLMKLVRYPGDVDERYIDSDLCNKLTSPNDDPSIADDVREAQLIEAGAAVGINFTFVD